MAEVRRTIGDHNNFVSHATLSEFRGRSDMKTKQMTAE